MVRVIPSASLCPIRLRDSEIEVLLTRREFWNYQKNRPMRHPGEWMFAGGSREDCDVNLYAAAVREFREELLYEGNISRPKLLRADHQEAHGRKYYVEFWASRIDPEYSLHVSPNGEVIDIRWMRPEAALELLHSEEFTREQNEEFEQRRLDDPRFGIYAVTARQFPRQNVLTLERIMKSPDLREMYADG